jgi:class 3 adenylate cyclase
MTVIAALNAVATAASQLMPRIRGLSAHRMCSAMPRCLEDEFWRLRKKGNAERRRASLTLAVPLVALFGILDAYVAPSVKVQLWLIRFGIFLPVVVALLALTVKRPFHKASEAAVVIGVCVGGACLTAMTLIAPVHFAGILLLVFASYTFLGLRCVHAAGGALSASMVYVIAAAIDERVPVAMLAINLFFLSSCNIIGTFVCYVLEQAARRDFSHTRALSEQRRMSDRLLRNVLPVSVARRLKSHFGVVADGHPDVTILFADIVGFTNYAASVAPARLVRLLDEVFTCFDRLAVIHGVEKIKTIGDAYMVAGGLGACDFDHARAVADMALDMLDAIGTVDPGDGRRLGLRIGIHTGPVVAGVIGRTKFAYDLWGDTVNVASRLEGLALPGTIQVSAATYERLCGRYDFSPRQLVEVKGRGELPCYSLRARRASPKARLAGMEARGARAHGDASIAAPDLLPIPRGA